MYFREGLPHREEDVASEGILERQKIVISREGGNLKLTNFYIPPARGQGTVEAWQGALRQLAATEVPEGSLWCGDINAHNELWDPYLQPDARGEDVVGVLTERGLITANDGGATRYDRVEREGMEGRSAPDVTIMRMEESELVTWRVVEDLSSDHIPILIEWRREVRVSGKRRRVELNIGKGDWKSYKEKISERIGEVEVLTSMNEKLKSLIALMMNVAQEVCHAKVIRKEVVPWMTAEIPELRRRRNRARRDMTRRRGEWTEICRELKEKTILAKREIWRKQLEKIKDERNANRAWSLVKQMKGQRSENHSGAMLYRGKWRTTPKAKANAFIQKYAEISSGKSTKKTRKEKVSVASHLRKIGPRREIEKDLTIDEMKQSVRALKNGKAPGPDGIRPEFL